MDVYATASVTYTVQYTESGEDPVSISATVSYIETENGDGIGIGNLSFMPSYTTDYKSLTVEMEPTDKCEHAGTWTIEMYAVDDLTV
jgi:hypothetical protein